jgi:integrative and conjugative element protein (TIGR02256 family)
VSTENRLLFDRPHGGVVLLGSNVVLALEAHRQLRWCAPESGGVLLGRIIERSNDVIVDEITEPSRLDKAGRFFFRRARAPAQERIQQAWHETRGTRNYLGEWHSHPEPDPSPSPHDARDWLRLCAEARFEQSFLLFIIVGQRTMGLWEVSLRSATLAACRAR